MSRPSHHDASHTGGARKPKSHTSYDKIVEALKRALVAEYGVTWWRRLERTARRVERERQQRSRAA